MAEKKATRKKKTGWEPLIKELAKVKLPHPPKGPKEQK